MNWKGTLALLCWGLLGTSCLELDFGKDSEDDAVAIVASENTEESGLPAADSGSEQARPLEQRTNRVVENTPRRCRTPDESEMHNTGTFA